MDAVVVTYNSEEDLSGLIACAPLLAAFDRIVVVDNGSTDDTLDLAHSAGLDVLARGTNDGFGAAVNVGAGITRGDCFAVLNPDIRVPDAAAVRLLEAACRRPGVGVAVPRLRLADGSLQDSARMVPTPLDLILRRTVASQALRGGLAPHEPTDVPWAVGACWVVRRAAFVSVGGFDERFFLYFEDVDLCVRLRRRGWSVRFEPTAEVIHHHRGESRRSLRGRAMRLHLRSAARFYAHHPRYVLPRVMRRPRHLRVSARPESPGSPGTPR